MNKYKQLKEIYEIEINTIELYRKHEFHTILEALEKAQKYDEMMTPKKPSGKLVKSCGNCGIVPIDCISNANIKHCWNCGQLIDWSDEE